MKHNFNSGPSILPREVFEEASRAIIDFNDTGLSILEIGHRTEWFEGVMQEAIQLVRELMALDASKKILFLHGGASTQFFQVPMNLLASDGTAAYLDAGIWGSKAIAEARHFGHVHVLGSSKANAYTSIPKDYTVPDDASYVHITSNNTVEGTQQHNWPSASAPLVCDMSSDILSRSLPFNNFGLIYAGAQKNLGAAGVNLVVVDEALLGKSGRIIPTMLDYRQHIAANSMLNTPPVFAVYVCMLTLRWLKKQGGVQALEPLNRQKAQLLYNTLDRLPLFHPTVARKDRSVMNVVWRMDEALEPLFLEVCNQEGLVGIRGHRTAGGFRASLYNALPLSSVETLVSIMEYFSQKHG